MLFNTIDFIIFFITVASILVLVKNRKFQYTFLLSASYFFFYYSSNYLILLLIYTTIWDYYLGKEIWKATSKTKKKSILILSLAGNLGLLGFFKYADFAITQFNFIGHQFDLSTNIPLLHLALPIGISFYTFHSITYTVGIYRKQLSPAKSFVEYAIFVAFFPQLVAGPILRAKEFLPQLREKIENLEMGSKLRQITIQSSNLKLGITIMAFGFLKKMFFADNIAPLVNSVLNYPVGQESFTIILSVLAFGIQIYCDFSGYTDIAIGASTIFGFKIPINFNKPYFAYSPSDFWRKWHISLSSWLRDYLYIPLGGNRKSRKRTFLNLFIVMFLGGLWHGAAWNFVIWGMLHGAYLAVHKVLSDRFVFLKKSQFVNGKLGLLFSIVITQYLVFFAWIFFRVKNLDYAIYAAKKYVFLDLLTTNTYSFVLSNKFQIVLMLSFFILHFISYRKPNIRERISKIGIIPWALFLLGIMLLILLFYNGHPEDFIYFQF